MSDQFAVVRQFEAAVAEYTGAPCVVTTTSCTMAITLALAFIRATECFVPPYNRVSMPRLSYVGVLAAIRNSGFQRIGFRDDDWQGEYRFGEDGMRVWDSARRFTSGMYRRGQMQCVSFHASKILGDTQGGAILLDNPDAVPWLRRARFDGRTEDADPKTDQVQYPSWHAYMSPDVAARLLWKLAALPKHNADLPRSDYPDLSKMEAFR